MVICVSCIFEEDKLLHSAFAMWKPLCFTLFQTYYIEIFLALFLLFSEFYNIECAVPFVVLDKQRYHAYFMEEIYSWMIIFAGSLLLSGFLLPILCCELFPWFLLYYPYAVWLWILVTSYSVCTLCPQYLLVIHISQIMRTISVNLFDWITSTDWVAVLACSFAIIGLLDQSMHRRRWIHYSWYTAVILAIFWLYYMLR